MPKDSGLFLFFGGLAAEGRGHPLFGITRMTRAFNGNAFSSLVSVTPAAMEMRRCFSVKAGLISASTLAT
jgi:hypothetical protein